jgi:APA family basic amino acid/polyamine antiporter
MMTIEDMHAEPAIQPRLGLWDAVSIIVGIVVGTSIFRGTAKVFDSAGGPWTTMALWLVGGALAWCGAVCYAELATTYPRDGGDYEYLNRAFGTWCGFLFAWSQITIIISGNIAIMAYAFADYAVRTWPTMKEYAIWLTLIPIVALSVVNAAGIVAGKITQNVLTLAKVAGLTGLIAAGIFATAAPLQPPADAAIGQDTKVNIGLALVFVLYTYGGWTHAAYVAAEVRDEARNLPRALMLGIAGITLIYLAVNAAYLNAIGFEAARNTSTPAADVVTHVLGPWGGRAISLLIMLSALGAINGMILTGTRIYAVWGADYPALAWLSSWNRRTAAPIAAIVLQAVFAAVLVLLVGTETGRNWFDSALNLMGIDGLPWEAYFGGFETLVAGSAPAYWSLCLLTGVAVFVLRRSHRSARRRFTIPWFPFPAIAFCATCAYMLWSSIDYARWLSLLGVVPIVVGGVAWIALRFVRPGTPR